MRIVKVFWALDAGLAYRRHFPSINWLRSYSLYLDALKPWFDENLGPDFTIQRERAMQILQEEASLNEIVQLVGKDSLSPADQLTLETAKIIREDFLQQNAFSDIDSFTSHDRQRRLMGLVLGYDKLCREAIEKGARVSELFAIPARDRLGRAKGVDVDKYVEAYDSIYEEMTKQIEAITAKGGQAE
jgi:V/A-type H+-transporting ATPase subunit A